MNNEKMFRKLCRNARPQQSKKKVISKNEIKNKPDLLSKAPGGNCSTIYDFGRSFPLAELRADRALGAVAIATNSRIVLPPRSSTKALATFISARREV